jgi:hypothetical protein
VAALKLVPGKEEGLRMFKAITALLLLLTLSCSALSYGGAAQHKRLLLRGTWEGTGYQIDDNSTWTMRLTVRAGKFSIAYPSLDCGGEWKLKRTAARRSVFRERLSYGKDKCTDNSLVVIERLSKRQLMVLFTNPGEKQVNSSGILNRSTTAQAHK